LNKTNVSFYGEQNEWHGDPDSSEVDDIGFVSDMIAHFSERYCIDTFRVYAAGKSDGGGLINLLACDPILSTQIAAFAPVSGAFYVNGSSDTNCNAEKIVTPCSPGRKPVPILDFHGSADSTILYSGGLRRGECLPSIPHWVQEWSERDGFGTMNQPTNLYDGKVQKSEFGRAQEQLGIVTHYLTDGLDHSWPSIMANDDNPAATYYDATAIIMDFFNKYTL
jgi:poly(3-hydroxybutyrate) depolymerase